MHIFKSMHHKKRNIITQYINLLTIPNIFSILILTCEGDRVPLSSKELIKLFLKEGYEVVQGGKGSHIKLKKKGCPTVIVPGHKELKRGTEQTLLKILEKSKKGE